MTERLRFIDALKGFAILLVVFGHCVADCVSSNSYPEFTRPLVALKDFIYNFHMPLFFMISGFVFYFSESYNRWRSRVLNLVLVYVIWCTVAWIFKRCFAGDVNHPVTLMDLAAIAVRPFFVYWYLYLLAVFYLVCSWFKITHVTLPLCLALAAVAVLSTHMDPDLGVVNKIAYHAFFFVAGGGIPI